MLTAAVRACAPRENVFCVRKTDGQTHPFAPRPTEGCDSSSVLLLRCTHVKHMFETVKPKYCVLETGVQS